MSDYAKIFRNNVRYICKKRKLHLSELEKQIGVAQGYFSRKSRGIEIEIAMNVSNLLNVCVNDLCNYDMARMARIAELKRELAELEAGNADE